MVAILMLVRVGLIEKVTFKRRLKECEGIHHADTRMRAPGWKYVSKILNSLKSYNVLF